MIVDEVDKLRTWVVAKVTPLCDAEPEALANYILALLKKDKPVEDLKPLMQKQLEVFLLNETVDFLDLLFTTVDSKSYLATTQDKGVIVVGDNTAANISPNDRIAQDSSKSETRRHRSARRRRRVGFDSDHSSSGSSDDNRVVSPTFKTHKPLNLPDGLRRNAGLPPRQTAGAASIATNLMSRRGRPFYQPQKCRDYEEKGFCLKGDQCAFSHGRDAVVLDDAPKLAGLTIAPPAPNVAPVDTSVPPPSLIQTYQPVAVNQQPVTSAYVPTASDGMKFTVPPPYVPSHTLSSATSIPSTVSLPLAVPHFNRSSESTVRPNIAPVQRGPKHRGGSNANPSSRGRFHLAVRNIPPELNNIAHLNNHFARFGSLVNVQVEFEGDPSSALVTFGEKAHCDAAYKHPDAVLNNRFIKMHRYFEPVVVKQTAAEARAQRKLVRARNANQQQDTTATANHKLSGNKSESGASSDIKDSIAQNEMLPSEKVAKWICDQSDKPKPNNENTVDEKADHSDAHPVPMTRSTQVQLGKSLQQLLDKYIDEQKNLLTLFEKRKDSLKPTGKAAMLTMMNGIADKIDKTKTKLRQTLQTASVKTSLKRRSVGEIDKDIAAAEAELAEMNYCDVDVSEKVTEIEKRLAKLKSERIISNASITSSLARKRKSISSPNFKRTHYVAPDLQTEADGSRTDLCGDTDDGTPVKKVVRKKMHRSVTSGSLTEGTFTSPTSVDRRCVKLAVSGFSQDEQDDVIAHFRQFGEIVSTVIAGDADTTTGAPEKPATMLVHFRDRKNAETAKIAGQVFGVEQTALQIDWHIERVSPPRNVKQDGEEEEDDGAVEDDYKLNMAYVPAGLENGLAQTETEA